MIVDTAYRCGEPPEHPAPGCHERGRPALVSHHQRAPPKILSPLCRRPQSLPARVQLIS